MKSTLKKIKTAIIVAGCLASAMMPFTSAYAEAVLLGYKGDLNCDMEVNVADAVILTQHLLGREPLSGEYSIYADTNTDNIIDVFDLILLKQYLTGAREIEGVYGEDTQWTPPAMEDLVYEGEQIDQTTYDILIDTAEAFGIDRYKIVWSDHPIEYAYADPGLYYSMKMGVAYGYGVQIAPGAEVKTLCPNMTNLDASYYKFDQFLCYRPIVEDDSQEEVLAGFDVTYGAYKDGDIVVMDMEDIIEPERIDTNYMSELLWANEFNPFNFVNWYLVPIDEKGNEIYEMNTNEYTEVKTSFEPTYWFTNEELLADGRELRREDFYAFLKTAEFFGFSNFKFIYSEDVVYYGFNNGNFGYGFCTPTGTAQIVPGTDITILNPNLYQSYIDSGYSEEEANALVEHWKNSTYIAWIKEELVKETVENDILYSGYYVLSNYYMIPLDENGNEILKLMYPVN